MVVFSSAVKEIGAWGGKKAIKHAAKQFVILKTPVMSPRMIESGQGTKRRTDGRTEATDSEHYPERPDVIL